MKGVRRAAGKLLLSLVVAHGLASPVAYAQGNDRSAPTGGRSALMGNTGIAFGSDGAAAFMNPATVVGIRDQAIAFSVNFLDFNNTHTSSWHQPGTVDASKFGPVNLGGTDISTAGFSPLPSTLCLFFTIAGPTGHDEASLFARGRQKLAFCFGTLESRSFSLPAVSFLGKTSAGTTSQAQSVAESWNRVQAGPTYSFALTDRLALGLSLHVVSTSDSFSLDGASITSEVGGGAVQTSLESGGHGQAFDMTAIVGATYRFGKVTVGLSSQLVPVHLFGNYNGVLQNSYAAVTTHDSALTVGSGSFWASLPIRVGVGVGIKQRRFTAEVDASFDVPWGSEASTSLTGSTTTLTATGATMAPLTASYTIPSHPVFNAAIGGEYFVSQSFSLLSGFSTNFSSVPGLAPSMTLGNLAPERMSWVNTSLGIGSYGSAGSILIGVVLGYGRGQAIALNPYVLPNNWSVVDTWAYDALFVLAGAINVGSMSRAVQEVQSVISTGNPDAFIKTPAKALPVSPDAGQGPPDTTKPEPEPEKTPGGTPLAPDKP
jgi:hypothetical protein